MKAINKDYINVTTHSINHNTDYIVRNLWYLGFIDSKMISGYYMLSDRGLQFLLWVRKNYFKIIVEYISLYHINNIENFIKFLIPEKDLALALSITCNSKKLLSCYDLT